MTSRVVRSPQTSINLIDWIFSAVAALAAGVGVYQIEFNIDYAVVGGFALYVSGLIVFYYRRNYLAYRAYVVDKIPSRLVDSEAEARHLREQVKYKDVTVAVLGRKNASSRNVASFPAALRQSFSAISDLDLQDGDSVSRRQLKGILSRSQVAQLADRLIDLELAERVHKTCVINQSGVDFFASYAGLGGLPQSNAHEPAHADSEGGA